MAKNKIKVKKGKRGRKKKMITLSTVMERYGIPKRLIDKYLKPELVVNPRYKCAAPMKLYPESKVKAIAKHYPKVRAAIANHVKRSAAAKKATQTKMNKMQVRINEAIKNISVAVEADVRKNAINHYEERNWCKIQNPNKSFLDRITVNYIRHVLTDYEEELWNVSGKVGRSKFHKQYKCAVLDEIAKAYPKLKGECHNQKAQLL